MYIGICLVTEKTNLFLYLSCFASILSLVSCVVSFYFYVRLYGDVQNLYGVIVAVQHVIFVFDYNHNTKRVK